LVNILVHGWYIHNTELIFEPISILVVEK